MTVRTPTRARAPPDLDSQMTNFLVLDDLLCAERTVCRITSPRPLAFFLGGKPGSSSPEQLVPGTLTVLSPRKKLVLKKQCLLSELPSRQADGSGVSPCWFEGIFLFVGTLQAAPCIPSLPMLTSSDFCICLDLHKHSVESFRKLNCKVRASAFRPVLPSPATTHSKAPFLLNKQNPE